MSRKDLKRIMSAVFKTKGNLLLFVSKTMREFTFHVVNLYPAQYAKNLPMDLH